jgi:hypothetical protein
VEATHYPDVKFITVEEYLDGLLLWVWGIYAPWLFICWVMLPFLLSSYHPISHSRRVHIIFF